VAEVRILVLGRELRLDKEQDLQVVEVVVEAAVEVEVRTLVLGQELHMGMEQALQSAQVVGEEEEVLVGRIPELARELRPDKVQKCRLVVMVAAAPVVHMLAPGLATLVGKMALRPAVVLTLVVTLGSRATAVRTAKSGKVQRPGREVTL